MAPNAECGEIATHTRLYRYLDSMEDYNRIVRNWGKASLVGQKNLAHWWYCMYLGDNITMKFFEGSLPSLEERREKALVIAHDLFKLPDNIREG